VLTFDIAESGLEARVNHHSQQHGAILPLSRLEIMARRFFVTRGLPT
jgi:hypothetical protein